MADIEKVKRNIGRMIDAGAPEADIDAYLSSEGVSAAELKAPRAAAGAAHAAEPYMQFRTGKRAPGGKETSLPTLDDIVRMVANGATFGLADKFAGGMDYLTGQAPSYTAGVTAQRAATEDVRKRNPVAAPVAELGGGVLTGAGLMRGGLTLAGRAGPNLLPRTAAYGAEGAAYGAAQGAGNTFSSDVADYVSNAKEGALFGGAVGAGLPVLGSVGSAAYRAGAPFVGGRVDDAGRGASALLRGAALADEQGLRNLPAMGAEAALPDAGPAMLGLAQGASTGTGEGRSALINMLQARDRGTVVRLNQSLDQNFGPAPIPSRIEAGIDADQGALSPQYGNVFNGPNVRAVNTQPIADFLDTLAIDLRGPAQTAVQRVRGYLNIPGSDRGGRPPALDPSPYALFETRQAIDGLMATETNPKVVMRLQQARQMVDEEVARAVPDVKDVDAAWAELERQRGALQRGGQVLDSGKTAIRPVELVDEVQAGALPQGTQVGPSAVPLRLRQGARADIDRRVGTNVNDLVQLERVMATPQDWNYQKLGTMFGDAQRDAVARDIATNRQFRDTYQKVAQNSQTAQRTEAAKAMDGAAGGNIPHDLTATSLGFRAANAIAKLLSGQSAATTKDEIGRLLSRQGPEANRLAQMLLSSAGATNQRANTLAALLSAPEWIPAASASYGGRR